MDLSLPKHIAEPLAKKKAEAIALQREVNQFTVMFATAIVGGMAEHYNQANKKAILKHAREFAWHLVETNGHINDAERFIKKEQERS